MSNFTPRPWTFDNATGWICGDAKTVARVFVHNPAMGFKTAPKQEETAANGNLIAAAPDLYAALVELRKQLWGAIKPDVRKHYSLLVADAAAGTALFKAEGQGVTASETE